MFLSKKDKNDVTKYESRYDAAHSADILFIVALNLLLWGGVAVLCATLEYNVKVNVCVSIKRSPQTLFIWYLFENILCNEKVEICICENVQVFRNE